MAANLHEFFQSKLRVHASPPVQVEFENLSLSVEVPLQKSDVPTLASTVLGVFGSRGTRLNGKQTKRKAVLQKCSGILEPGSITLLLGPQHHGKSTLLRVLAGKIARNHFEGQIWFAGIPTEKICTQDLVAYVSKQDIHHPLLTVRETLTFANACVKGDALNVDRMLSMFGLSHAANTRVGDGPTGLSGGERKRVTLAEMLLGNHRVWLLDDVSTGLDARITRELISLLKDGCRALKTTCLVVLLQPPPEVFQLFDRVMLMREGSIVFHGPQSEIMPYFEAMGLPVPVDQAVCEFIIEYLSDPVRLWSRQAKSGRTPPFTTEDMIVNYRVYLRQYDWNIDFNRMQTPNLKNVLDSFEVKSMSSIIPLGNRFWTQLASTRLSLAAQLLLLCAREARLFVRNTSMVRAHAIVNTVIGTLFGSIFFHLSATAFQVRLGALFLGTHQDYLVVIKMYMVMARKHVAHKQISAGLYSTLAFIISLSVSTLPIAVLDAVMLSIPIYWMAGLGSTAVQFLFYTLVVLVSGLVLRSFYRMLTFMNSNIEKAVAYCGPLASLAAQFAGYLVTRNEVTSWLRWLYWLSPMSWALRSVAINEFSSSMYGYPLQSTFSGATMTASEVFFEAYDIYSGTAWKWAGVMYCVCLFLVIEVMCFAAMRWMYSDTATALPFVEPPETMIAPTRRTNLEWDGVDSRQRDAENNSVLAPLMFRRAKSKRDLQELTPAAVTLQVDTLDDSHQCLDSARSVTLAFKDITYSVQSRTVLLGAFGIARPGTMTALMGSSGAGKTTLLNILADRALPGVYSGSISVNGRPKHSRTFAKQLAFVEQHNSDHHGFSTVREALVFASRLRSASSLSPGQLNAYVARLITELELEAVGDWPVQNLPRGERKRFAIGVELVTEPAIIFLDEPTSGLDSREAASVMRVIKKQALQGRTVVATIHQPSYEVFHSFEELLLLHRGGEVAYAGPLGALIEYMLQVSQVDHAPSLVNLASWMLEVLDGDTCAFSRNAAASVFLGHELARRLKAEIEAIPARATIVATVHDVPLMTQFALVVARTMKEHWRSIDYNVGRLSSSLFIGVLCGTIYYQSSPHDFPSTVSNMGAVFSFIFYISLVSHNTSIPPASTSLQVFKREAKAHMYNSWIPGIAQGLTETLFTTALFTPGLLVFYGMAGFSGDPEHFALYFLACTGSVLALNAMGQCFMAISPSAAIAFVFGGSLFLLFNICMGTTIPRPSIPTGWKWLHYSNPMAYAAGSIITSHFHCEGSLCPSFYIANASVPIEAYVQSFTGFSYRTRWTDVLFVYVIFLVFRISAMLGSRWALRKQ